MATNLAETATKILCMDPEIKALSKEQLYALHEFKHEVIARIFRLYPVIPQPQADTILKKYFEEVLKTASDGGADGVP